MQLSTVSTTGARSNSFPPGACFATVLSKTEGDHLPGRHFSVGTRPEITVSPAAWAVAEAVVNLLASQNRTGTWGGPDSLDELVATCHATMTLMSVGVPYDGAVLKPSFAYLAKLNTNRSTTFYWRCGPLLNVPGFEEIVRHDIEHLWQHKGRAGGNPSYPAPFFLLKLIRFFADRDSLAVGAPAVVDWIVSEWSEQDAWYGRTSITSMGLALVADLDEVPREMKNRAAEFLVDSYGLRADGRRGFSDNAIDDAFTVYNLFERRSEIANLVPESLWELAGNCADDLVSELVALPAIDPPFGGSVDSPSYARAVLARAIMARELAIESDFESGLAIALASAQATKLLSTMQGLRIGEPFWGDLEIEDDGYCFVLMPFTAKRTRIYERYIKQPLWNELGIECRRADDLSGSRPIMEDVWRSINRARFLIADLSSQRPNVLYELGMAHVLGKPVILVAEKREDVVFDVAAIRTIIYGSDAAGLQRLKNQVLRYAAPYGAKE